MIESRVSSASDATAASLDDMVALVWAVERERWWCWVVLDKRELVVALC